MRRLTYCWMPTAIGGYKRFAGRNRRALVNRPGKVKPCATGRGESEGIEGTTSEPSVLSAW